MFILLLKSSYYIKKCSSTECKSLEVCFDFDVIGEHRKASTDKMQNLRKYFDFRADRMSAEKIYYFARHIFSLIYTEKCLSTLL